MTAIVEARICRKDHPSRSELSVWVVRYRFSCKQEQQEEGEQGWHK